MENYTIEAKEVTPPIVRGLRGRMRQITTRSCIGYDAGLGPNSGELTR